MGKGLWCFLLCLCSARHMLAALQRSESTCGLWGSAGTALPSAAEQEGFLWSYILWFVFGVNMFGIGDNLKC